MDDRMILKPWEACFHQVEAPKTTPFHLLFRECSKCSDCGRMAMTSNKGICLKCWVTAHDSEAENYDGVEYHINVSVRAGFKVDPDPDDPPEGVEA